MPVMDLVRDGQRAFAVAQRVFSGRDGRLALTLTLAVVATLEAIIYTPDVEEGFPFEQQGDPALAVFFNLLAVAPLLVASRFPVIAAGATSFCVLVLLGSPEAPVTLTATGVLLYTVGHLVARRGLVYGAGVALPFLLNAAVPFDGRSARLSSVLPFLLVVGAVIVGESTRRRTEIVDALSATQERMATSEREQTAMEERARIARELHDIVAHHLSVIAVQSETARLTSPRLSADARGRFEAIAATARDALTETRRLLGVLREDVSGGADRSPQPGLDQLPELVDTARDSGTQIRLIMQGKAVPLPAGIDLAAYRIVQEALTNARRHAPGADVDVEVSYGDDTLLLRVSDHGPGLPDGELAAGHGLVGMRDRAAIAGGTFFCGAAEGGGFVVEVTLPTKGAIA